MTAPTDPDHRPDIRPDTGPGHTTGARPGPAHPPARILVVEDEPALARLLADYLRAAGHQVQVLGDGAAVIPALRAADPASAPQLMVLDLMLPGRDGLSICRELRGFSALPVLMLTARVEEIDRLIGLEAGADDYVCKPFSPREVVARVAAILRRMQPVAPWAGAMPVAARQAGAAGGGLAGAQATATHAAAAAAAGAAGSATATATASGPGPGAGTAFASGVEPGRGAAGPLGSAWGGSVADAAAGAQAAQPWPGAGGGPPLFIDVACMTARLHGQLLELTPLEFRLLRALAAHPGRVWSRDQLLDKLHDDHRALSERTVDSHVKNLRRKLQAAGAQQDPIRSIYGVGYALELLAG